MTIKTEAENPLKFGNSSPLPRCARVIGEIVRAGADRYDRTRHLPWLARTTPDELTSNDPAVAGAIVGRLVRALRAERQRGKAGHWTYDMNRHIALMQALAAERQRLEETSRKGGP
jgi:hypothetical protein